MTDVKSQDVQALIELFDASTWTELHIQLDDFELHLNKDASARRTLGGTEPARKDIAALPPSGPTLTSTSAATAAAPTQAPLAQADDIPDGMTVLRAPNLGTFYRSPKPGAPTYIEIGQKVDADTDVCLIEVMKLFTPVKAGIAGTVRKILVADAELVEFDQPLFLIEPTQ